jgi:cellulose synthase/poly-beta-1,6-N-acetylglucosamine synthase-like glycosyltransferase
MRVCRANLCLVLSAGTNFAIRSRALCHAKWFPTYTITEDYALGYELKKLGYNGSYLAKYLAVGEAPDEIRNVFRQRSRWTKGHMQVGGGSAQGWHPCCC